MDNNHPGAEVFPRTEPAGKPPFKPDKATVVLPNSVSISDVSLVQEYRDADMSDREVCLKVARELGHGRISATYLYPTVIAI